MNNLPIGIFDSGLGGLTVAKEIYKVLPNESTIYVGDTARVPYGPRSKETIIRFSRQIIDFLISQKVKAVVIACYTASSQAIDVLKKEYSIPIFGMIEPATKQAISSTQKKRIGLIGTTGTINSGRLSSEIQNHLPTAKVFSKACPLLVPAIEEGMTSGPLIQQISDYYLNSFNQTDIDTLILGCTHYPLIKNVIGKNLDKTIHILNPGKQLAEDLKNHLSANDLGTSKRQAEHTYFVTDDKESFSQQSQTFLGNSIKERITQIVLD